MLQKSTETVQKVGGAAGQIDWRDLSGAPVYFDELLHNSCINTAVKVTLVTFFLIGSNPRGPIRCGAQRQATRHQALLVCGGGRQSVLDQVGLASIAAGRMRTLGLAGAGSCFWVVMAAFNERCGGTGPHFP
jgi:hypothetical protein